MTSTPATNPPTPKPASPLSLAEALLPVVSLVVLVTALVGAVVATNVVTADQYIAIVLPAMFRNGFRARGLAPVVLSPTQLALSLSSSSAVSKRRQPRACAIRAIVAAGSEFCLEPLGRGRGRVQVTSHPVICSGPSYGLASAASQAICGAS
jgi:hypothetical protein